ncbi:hypothetical protein MATL_G00085990 [Megalops atlanticus]|uniref:Leucine rich repeat containing 75B n=1 Tax=Megalops atlanticus TaxID=7932 RepID=A0A9D3TDZ2_MEGAT|nr:hypothetical protein MATL_G00085990 [Megalops atlanticus]
MSFLSLLQDLALEGTSLNDILYKNASFLNLVDPISHELLLNLARDLQCPKKDMDPLKSSDKICRQLIYHLTPHSKLLRQGVKKGGPKKKSQACIKSILQKRVSADMLDLSGIPLSRRDIHRVVLYLQSSGDLVETVDLSFTGLQDEHLRLLLPFLATLPKLSTLALNGNRLTVAAVKDLTEMVKNPRKFPDLAWVDLGNNVDIFTLPQPLLVALRRRLGLKSSLPTIYEQSEAQPRGFRMDSSTEDGSLQEEEEEDEEEGEEEDRLELESWGVGDKTTPCSIAGPLCER